MERNAAEDKGRVGAVTTVECADAEGVRLVRLVGTGTNTLDAQVVAALQVAVRAAQADAAAVLLCGGSRFFCNGLDLVWALERTREQLLEFFLALGDLVLDLLELSVPVGAAMAGHAIGAGKSLVLAADVRVGATGRCLFGAPEVLLGVPNPVFGDRLLRAVAADHVANRLLYTGALISAEEATALGLLDATAEAAQVEQEAAKRLQLLAGVPRDAWTASKRQRSLDLCTAIRGQLLAHTEQVLLAHWFSDETQRLLNEAAARLAR